jgi:hypothetical protein
MPRQQQIDILTDAFLAALMAQGILPEGTTRVSIWAGNVPDGQGGVVSHIKINVANESFDDLTPIPTSSVNVPAAIEALGG